MLVVAGATVSVLEISVAPIAGLTNIGLSGTSAFAALAITSTVRVERFAISAAPGVVKPLATTASQSEPTGIAVEAATVKTNVFAELSQTALFANAALPHVPEVLVAAIFPPEPVKPGKVSLIVSLTATTTATLNLNFTCVEDATVKVVSVSVFTVKPWLIAEEIGMACAPISAKASAATISTVRVGRLATWADAGVLRPLATVTWQNVFAGREALATITFNISVECVQVPVKVEVPQPVSATVRLPTSLPGPQSVSLIFK